MQYEEGCKDRDEEIKFKEHVDKTGERRHVANKESLLWEHEATLKNKAKHSSVKKRFLNIYYTTSFKVTILFNHFWSLNNSEENTIRYFIYSEEKIILGRCLAQTF